MARPIEYANGLRRIEFTLAKGGPRRLVRLGRMPRRDAKMLNSRLEHIIAAKTVGFAIDAETGRWLGNSPAVAARHFAMSTDRDGSFQRAISREPVGVKSAVDLAGITAKTVNTKKGTKPKRPANDDYALVCTVEHINTMGVEGLEPSTLRV